MSRIFDAEQLQKVCAARQIPLEGNTIEWDGVTFHVVVRDRMLMLWARQPYEGDVSVLREFIRTWHAENYWPRLSYRIDDAGQLSLHADAAADWENGVGDYQLAAMLTMSLAKIREAFREVRS